MERIVLSAQGRSEIGKNANRRLRQTGRIPTVLYGLGLDTLKLSVDRGEFIAAVRRAGDEMVMFEVSAANAGLQNQLTVIRDMQRDPVTDQVIHVDLLRVDMSKPLDVEVPVHGEGDPVGLREGGVLEQHAHTLHIRSLPHLVPSHVSVDITGLGLNQSLHAGDLHLAEGIEILTPAGEMLFHVVLPRQILEPKVSEAVESTEAAAEGAEGAEGAKAAKE